MQICKLGERDKREKMVETLLLENRSRPIRENNISQIECKL